MSRTKSERRFHNRLVMRLSHIDLDDDTPPTPKQTQDFLEEMERTHKHLSAPKHHPHKRVNK
jgi:hypothetical protein